MKNRPGHDGRTTMRTAAAMTVGCIATSVAAVTLTTPPAALEIWLGMIAPLAAALTSMAAIERVFSRDPRQLTSVMITAFAAKMVLFGAYVGVVVGTAPVAPVPFVASFVAYFVALHLTEAMWLRALFGTAMS